MASNVFPFSAKSIGLVLLINPTFLCQTLCSSIKNDQIWFLPNFLKHMQKQSSNFSFSIYSFSKSFNFNFPVQDLSTKKMSNEFFIFAPNLLKQNIP